MREPPWSPRLVIFDVFNTLVLPQPGYENTFVDGLRDRGIPQAGEIIGRLQSGCELEHPQISTSRETYTAWAAEILDRIAARGLTDDLAPHAVAALEQVHQAPMRSLPGVLPLLTSLREQGISIAVCSNWSWDLSDDLRACGLRDLVDVVLSSGRAGYRKPHPAIYRQVLARAGVDAAEALFVGDSQSADVDGPINVGIPAVHVLRSDLPSTARWRIGELSQLPNLLT
jgi:putative hydrolase of the HAD superfamily